MSDRRAPQQEWMMIHAVHGANPGLCATCGAAERVVSSRGSVFWMCGRAATDDRFLRYPVLPVITCIGFEPAPPGAEP